MASLFRNKCLGNHSAIMGSVLYMKVVPDKI